MKITDVTTFVVDYFRTNWVQHQHDGGWRKRMGWFYYFRTGT